MFEYSLNQGLESQIVGTDSRMCLGCGERKSLCQNTCLMFVLFNRLTFGFVACIKVLHIVNIENNYWDGIN